MNTSYDDIISLPHYEPRHHPRMSNLKRAAQFAPFAALTGHSEVLREEERRTEEKPDLDESEREQILRTLHAVTESLSSVRLHVRWFVEDKRKSGGSFREAQEKVRRIDEYSGMLFLETGERIPLQDIVAAIIAYEEV